MQAKVFEVVDNGSRYSILAVKHTGEIPKEQWLLDRVGLGEGGYPLQVTNLENGRTERDCFRWRDDGRTIFKVHGYLMTADHFDVLETGVSNRHCTS
jgi:hypothetical protein